MKQISLRTRIGLIVGAAVLATTTLPVTAATASTASVPVTSHFVVTDDPPADVIGDAAYLDNSTTAFHPNAIVFVALNVTPGGVCGCATVPQVLGVFYDTSRSEWAVFSEDNAAMPAAPSFNVLVAQKQSPSVFVHRAKSSNTSGNHTFINNRLLNGNPRASIQIAQDFNPAGAQTGMFNPHPVGVRYYPSKRKWAIFNEDNAPMRIATAFNVMIGSAPSNGGKTGLVTVTTFDHNIGTILVKNRVSNNDPNNVTFVTQVFNPGGKGGVGDAHPLEVAYPGVGAAAGRETLDNADGTSARIGAHFNVLIFNS